MPTTAEIIAQALKEEGVRHAFGIPGGEVLEVLEAFRKAGIKFILTKQELGAGFMADAAYQLTGKPGVLVATLGPGITNTTTAVAHALLDRSAVIVITGEIATSLKAVHTHQIIDQDLMMRPLVKWSTTHRGQGGLRAGAQGPRDRENRDARPGAFQCADRCRRCRTGGRPAFLAAAGQRAAGFAGPWQSAHLAQGGEKAARTHRRRRPARSCRGRVAGSSSRSGACRSSPPTRRKA